MLDPKTLDDLAKRFADAIPPGVRQLQTEMEKNFHALLQATFAKLDLVTREEFEVQQGVLARTRAKVDELERRVAELQAKCLGKASVETVEKTDESASSGPSAPGS